MNEITKTPERLGAEIRELTAQARCVTVYYGIEIGRRLSEAKAMLSHGEWGKWIEEETEFSQSTASRFMKIFEEYGDAQIGIFGAAENSSTLQNMSVSAALRLLAVPKDEREEFVAEVDAEHLSVRELEQAIRERDEAKAALEQERSAAEGSVLRIAALEEKLQAAKEQEDAAAEQARTLRERIRELESRPVEVAVEADEQAVYEAAEAARQDEQKKARLELDQLRGELRIAEAKREAAEAAKKAAEKQAADGKELIRMSAEKINTLKKTAEQELREKTEQLRQEAETLRKELAMSDAAATEFRIHFEAWQREYAALAAAIAQAGEETAAKLKAARRAQIEAWREAQA